MGQWCAIFEGSKMLVRDPPKTKQLKYMNTYLDLRLIRSWNKVVLTFNTDESKYKFKKIYQPIWALLEESLRVGNRSQETTCDKFWISVKSEYAELSKQSITTLLPFIMCG